MAKASDKQGRLIEKAKEMVEAGVDLRLFHNTFFGPESELLSGKTREERAALVKSRLYKTLQRMANELGVEQGYLERNESGKVVERKYSGSFVMRLPVSLHRQLAVEARREGVSLNQLCTAKLARPLSE